MYRIRINKLFSEVGGNISGAEATFKTGDGHERKVEGKVISEGGYEFTMAGNSDQLTTVHGDRVVLDFEVLERKEDTQ